MTNEISKHGWKRFFSAISRNYSDWQTRVEILKDDLDAQLLSEGLPLIELSFEQKMYESPISIEIMLGAGSGVRQTHTVFNPKKIYFKESERVPGGTIEIHDESGEQTLIRLVQPISVMVGYGKPQISTWV